MSEEEENNSVSYSKSNKNKNSEQSQYSESQKKEVQQQDEDNSSNSSSYKPVKRNKGKKAKHESESHSSSRSYSEGSQSSQEDEAYDQSNSEDDDSYSASSEYKNKKKKKSSKSKVKSNQKSKKGKTLLNKKHARSSNKKKKRIRNNYIDIEADEDDNPEESSQGEIDDKQQQELLKKYDDLYLKRKNQMQKYSDLDDEELRRKYEPREDEKEGISENYDEAGEHPAPHKILPTSEDPKLFLVRCRIGKEKEIAETLYKKYFYYNKNVKEYKDKVKIFSVISFDGLKGAIYIEAFNEAHVRQAITGISTVYENFISVTPRDEMSTLFEFDKYEKIEIKAGDFVRVKSGPYEGDLAQVIHVEDPLSRIFIKLVPRIGETQDDLIIKKREKEKRNEQKEEDNNDGKYKDNIDNKDNNINTNNNWNSNSNNLDINTNNINNDKLKYKNNPNSLYENSANYKNIKKTNRFSRTKRIRPVQKLLNKNDFQEVLGETTLNNIGNVFVIDKQFFKDGFLIKKVKYYSLITKDVHPTMDELKMFEIGKSKEEDYMGLDNNAGAENKEDNGLFPLKYPISSIRVKFSKGDKVVISKSEFKGITATVVSHKDKIVSVIPNVEGLSSTVLEIPEEFISKQFLPGEIVTITEGANMGESGIIVDVEQNTIAVVYNDNTKNYFKVPCDQLILTKNVSNQTEQNSNYRIGDVVKVLNTTNYCYVINVSKYSLEAVDEQNVRKTLTVGSVEKVKINRKHMSIDSKRNPISYDNRVKVLKGIYAGIRGTVKVILKNFVFLHNNEFTATNGIFCELCENVEVLGGELMTMGYNTKDNHGNNYNIKVNQVRIPDNIKNMLNKRVYITGGNWKGYNGTVVKVSEKYLSVELNAKQKTVPINVDDCVDSENAMLHNDEFRGGNTPISDPKTPAYYPGRPSDYD